jgi:hypothetical protein
MSPMKVASPQARKLARGKAAAGILLGGLLLLGVVLQTTGHAGSGLTHADVRIIAPRVALSPVGHFRMLERIELARNESG